jgi:hypothetical protein
MYRSGLVPRPLAVLGLIGGPLVCLSGIAGMFDVFEQGGAGQGIATIPEFAWELLLGIHLTVKGFKPAPVLTEHEREVDAKAAAAPRDGVREPSPGVKSSPG